MDRSRRAERPRQLRALFQGGTLAGLSDAELLDRFVARRDEVAELAFAVLVERHGPAILRVCRSVLGNPHDAEDAFQATFLVLARKAETIRRRESVASWLHGVALRVAAETRFVATRRQRREREAAARRTESVVGSEDNGCDPAVYEELARLPEPFRAAVVLCYLEGRTCEEAAQQLGWPVGTVKSRLARARQRLNDRLRRRGLAPEAGFLAPALGQPVLTPLLPPALAGATLSAVVRFAFARVPVPGSGSATSLAQGVLRSMAITRWLKVSSILFVLGVTLAGAHLLAQKAPPDEPPPVVQAKSKHAFGSPVSVQEVKPGRLQIRVFEQGTLVPVGDRYVWNQVEGSRTIRSILPEATQVKNGQVVCELDASDLKVKLTALVDSDKGDGPEAAQLRTQIAQCTIKASGDGYVIHANDPSYPEHGRDIKEGATVRERQLLFRVLDPEGPVQVTTEIPESLLKWVRPGQFVRLRFDAFETFTGAVTSIAPLATPKLHLSRDGFTHRAFLSIDKRPTWLRAGMIGQVEILIPELDDVLSVPRWAIVYYDGKDHVAVKRPDGGFDWREVTLGGRGAQLVEIQEGIRSGENVVLNPLALMSPEERKAKLGPGPRENPR